MSTLTREDELAAEQAGREWAEGYWAEGRPRDFMNTAHGMTDEAEKRYPSNLYASRCFIGGAIEAFASMSRAAVTQ